MDVRRQPHLLHRTLDMLTTRFGSAPHRPHETALKPCRGVVAIPKLQKHVIAFFRRVLQHCRAPRLDVSVHEDPNSLPLLIELSLHLFDHAQALCQQGIHAGGAALLGKCQQILPRFVLPPGPDCPPHRLQHFCQRDAVVLYNRPQCLRFQLLSLLLRYLGLLVVILVVESEVCSLHKYRGPTRLLSRTRLGHRMSPRTASLSHR
mmetsp:Transcript_64464/g.153893  ORF Transcript_64464/g.153893 Transcript_64464/m.153893 type:complete len:205 (+) Transcript_64464:84-698(+)